MAAGINDKFLKVGVAGTLTQLSSPGHSISSTTITVGSTTNWPTDTAVIFGIRQVDSDGELVPNTYTEWRGVVSGSTLTDMVLMYGSDQVYPAAPTTQVFIPLSAARDNRLVDGILTEHKQDGTHKDITADSITADTATFESIQVTGTATSQGWTPLGDVPDTITANGNRNYTVVFNGVDHTSTLSPNMRMQFARTVATPNQCASLNGTNHYFSKSSPNKLTFTDDFTVSAWVKMPSPATADSSIISRFNGTSGWDLQINAVGQIVLLGYNGGTGNFSRVISNQSLPVNQWVHIAAQLDMSAFTATTSTSYIMVNGLDVPATVTRGGTNPTALIQAGNLEIGGRNGGLQPFSGKIAQAAIFSAKIAQATIAGYIDRGLVGTETNLASAYSLSNSLLDLNTTTPNDLTGNNGVSTTNADGPFGNSGASTTLEYALVLSVAFSTNTTAVVQLPAGCQLPTTGGISSVNYSTHKIPYGWPSEVNRWALVVPQRLSRSQASPSSGVYYNLGGQITVPVGSWDVGYVAQAYIDLTGSGDRTVQTSLSTSTSASVGIFSSPLSPYSRVANLSANIFISMNHRMRKVAEFSAPTTFYLNLASTNGTGATTVLNENSEIEAIPAGL